MQVKPKYRIFLVGCPRSGTTLLQSLLAGHPQIISFPESHFFNKLYQRIPFLRPLNIAPLRMKSVLQEFLIKVHHGDEFELLPRFCFFSRQYVKAFVNILDYIAGQNGKDLWVEKTPDHLLFIDTIEQYVSNVKFIHLIREGKDVVASLYDVSHKYPKAWRGPWTIDRCIDKWNSCIEHSRRHIYKPNHFFLKFENLLKDCEFALYSTCQFLEVPFYPNMQRGHRKAASALILADEPWKNKVKRDLQKFPGSKFEKLFDKDTKYYIESRLKSFNDVRIN
jgi:hypothetical protein